MLPQPRTIRIPTRPPEQQAWVVRASGGVFLQHFLQSGIAAIGHLDGYRRLGNDVQSVEIDREALGTWLLAKAETTKARASSHLSQISRFISDFRVGDLVVSVDDRNFAAGIVTGPAFLSRQAIEIPRGRNSSLRLEYQLRRPVSWGPVIRRASLPYAVEQSLFSHQTVFSIDDHAKAIYHLLYPAFVWDNTLHFSLNITNDIEVSNAHLAQLLLTLSYLEALAAVEVGDISAWKRIQKELESSALADQLQLSIKAGFMSPGELWGQLPASGKKMAGFAVLLAVLVGGLEIEHLKIGGGIVVDVSGVKIKPAISEEKIKAVTDYVKKHGVRAFIDAVGLVAPTFDTKPLDKPVPTPPKNDDVPVQIVNSTRRRT